VFLASFPRSGNTFVRQILFEAFNIRSYTVAEHEPQTNWIGGFAGSADWSEVPVAFIKTHETTQTGGRTWHIVRDGRDAMASYAKWLPALSRVKASDWGQKVMALDATAHVTTKFETLLRDPIGEVQFAIDMLGLIKHLPRISDTLTPFSVLQRRDPHHWRKGVTGDRSGLDVAAFERLNRDALEHFGYL